MTHPTEHQRAMKGDRTLLAIDKLVDLIVQLAPNDQPMCYCCIWSEIVKPLARRAVGWERGFPTQQAADPYEPGGFGFTVDADLSAVMELLDERREPETETEAWLRSSDAWDAVTSVWLERLMRADPGRGHRYPQPRTSAGAPTDHADAN